MTYKDKPSKEEVKILGSWLNSLIKITPIAMTVAIGAPLLNGLILILQYWCLSEVIDNIVIKNMKISDSYYQIFYFILFYFIRSTIAYIGELFAIVASENIKYKLRQLLFYKLWSQGPQWSKIQVSGSLANSIIEQVEILDGFFFKIYSSRYKCSYYSCSFFYSNFSFDKVVGLLLLLTIPMIPFFMILIGLGAEEASKKYLASFSKLSGFFADRVRGLDTLKLYGREEIELNSLKTISESLRIRTMKVLKIAFISSAVLEFFAALGVAGVAVYIGLNFLGFLNTNNEVLDLRMGLFFLLMSPEIYSPLRQMALHYHDRAAARAAAYYIQELFNGLPNLVDHGNSLDDINYGNMLDKFNDSSIELIVRNLSLDFPNSSDFVLRDINLHLEPNQHVCLIGPSGVGKTSLLESIVRLKKYKGYIYLNGYDLNVLPENLLRNKTCLIGQRSYVFEDTIAANIMISNPYASNSALLDAAERSLVLDFAKNFKDGLNTIIGKNGRGLSKGQIQRISVARLFLRDPDLILLDEPTAHLDFDTELHLIEEIINFSRKKTLLIVTHSDYISKKFSKRLLLDSHGIREI
ncbi:subfamily B ATP-binding cassette [Candidatus Kinetoplastibacterium desouzaii TCC079E]|uniref:Subfamily B ATP-binding cassette n=1 Tax=Candidatus Kinetoplastidibacterium desouzai TCC079E TaxID=1208919 RepID=M1LNB5_9PROT|nr:thiol reductant ABC exporter subunit CydD [Candidatus Kinetoplastibacterium desouzaii]AGF47197.1 subfamily B ATP-binding cassette [Candidatus Kinetoplastibacterium desouzaii TCC079E]